jgi:hypothetical protein
MTTLKVDSPYLEAKQSSMLRTLSFLPSLGILGFGIWLLISRIIIDSSLNNINWVIALTLPITGLYGLFHVLYTEPNIRIEENNLYLHFGLFCKVYPLQNITKVKKSFYGSIIYVKGLPFPNRVLGFCTFSLTPAIAVTPLWSNYKEVVKLFADVSNINV